MLEVAVLTSLEESSQLEQAMEESMVSATAMEETPSQREIHQQEDDDATLQSILSESVREKEMADEKSAEEVSTEDGGPCWDTNGLVWQPCSRCCRVTRI